MTLDALDILFAVAAFVLALAVFLNREWQLYKKRRGLLRPPGGRRMLYLDLDAMMTAAEDEEAEEAKPGQVFWEKIKRAIWFVVIVLMLSGMLLTVLPVGAAETLIMATAGAILGGITGGIVAIVMENARR